jgi:hypothetical protein
MRLALLTVFLLVLASPLMAADIWVPDDYGTIQEAISAASAGDLIIVRAGTYAESIALKDSVDITTNPQAVSNAIIDGNQSARTVVANGVTATLTSLTITNGWSPSNGGGIWIANDADITIDGCTIVSNVAVGQGGGIAIQGSRATITGSDIQINTAAGGGGIFISSTGPGEVSIVDSVVRGNTITTGSTASGGGLLAQNAVFSTSGTSYHSNVVEGSGGGIALDASTIEMTFCSVTTNTAGEEAGGIHFHNGSDGTVVNSTISGNSAPFGGGLRFTNASSASLTRTIISHSQAGAGMSCGLGAEPTYTCCLMWGNAGGDSWCGTDGGQNATADPQFCIEDPSFEDRNLTIQSDSPAAPANSACGELIGREGVGCGINPVEAASWGSIKATYR